MLVSLLLLFSFPAISDSLQTHGLQHASPLCPSPSPEVCPSSCPLHRWCHPAIPLLVSWSHYSAQMPCKLWLCSSVWEDQTTRYPLHGHFWNPWTDHFWLTSLLRDAQISDSRQHSKSAWKNILKNEPQCNIMYCHWHYKKKKKKYREGYKWFKT